MCRKIKDIWRLNVPWKEHLVAQAPYCLITFNFFSWGGIFLLREARFSFTISALLEAEKWYSCVDSVACWGCCGGNEHSLVTFHFLSQRASPWRAPITSLSAAALTTAERWFMEKEWMATLDHCLHSESPWEMSIFKEISFQGTLKIHGSGS